MVSISCIVVSYNNAEFIKKAIMSVVNQTMPVTEIIVADDGSTDGSREIITSLAGEYPQIKPIFREKNLGVAVNRDLAIKAAKNDLVTTLDGDDLYLPRKIEQEFLAIKDNSTEISYSDIRVITKKVGTDTKITRRIDTSQFSLLNQKERLNLLASRLVPIPRDMLLSKQLYINVGGQQARMVTYQDWDLKIRLAASPTKWAYSGVEGTVYHRLGSGRSSALSTKARIEAEYKVIDANRQLLQQNLGHWRFWQIAARVYIRNGRCFIGESPLGQFMRQVKTQSRIAFLK